MKFVYKKVAISFTHYAGNVCVWDSIFIPVYSKGLLTTSVTRAIKDSWLDQSRTLTNQIT